MVTLSLLTAALVAGLVFFLMYRADRNRNTPQPWLSAGLRSLLSFLCVLLVLAPEMNRRIQEEQKPLALFIQDHSLSVDRALGNHKTEFAAKRKELLSRLSKNFRVLSWNLDGPAPIDSLNRYTAGTTNLGKPIDQAIAQFYRQNLSVVIMASDGQINEGMNPAYCSFPLSSFMYAIAIGDTSRKKDLRISKLYANKTVSLNSEWEILADVVGENIDATEVPVTLSDETGREISRTSLRSQGGSISKQISFSLKADQEGLHQYTIKALPLTGENNTANNRNSITVEVLAEKKKILLAYAAPHPDIKAISAALYGHKQYELELRNSTELPADAGAYAAVILHQLPAAGKSIPAAWISGKNVWFIAGTQSNYAELNKLQQCVRFLPGGSRGSLQVQFQKSFSLFNPTPDLASVADQLPPLQTSADMMLSGAAQALFSETGGRPLWAFSSGNPATAVTTGEGIWRWRLYEFKNFGKQQAIDECILQTLNLLSNNTRDRRFRAELLKNTWSTGEQVIVSAWLKNAAGAAINTPEASFRIEDSSGKIRKFTFERSGTNYRLNLGALAAGTYSFVASTIADGKTYSDQGRFFVSETSLESLESGCNYPLLASLAQRNRGSVFMPDQLDALYDSIRNNTLIKPIVTERQEPVALISRTWLFFLILALATLEWILRKYWMAM